MNSIFLKLIGAHFLITIIIIVVTSLAINDITYFSVSVFSCFLYFISGYKLTNEKTNWINYFGVCAIGIVLWVICFALSPDSTNYKRNTEAGLWFFYKLYVMVNSPLNFIDSLNEPYNLRKELLMLFLTPFTISVFQYLGGRLKSKKFK